MAIPFLPILISVGLGLLSTVASTLIRQWIGQDKKQEQKLPGVRGERQTGGTNPMTFTVGRYGGAGQFEYGGEWGEVDGTPNAYRSELYTWSDLPGEALEMLFVNGKATAIDFGDEHPTLGFPVTTFRRDGRDYLWVRPFDGTQATADALMQDKFGAHPDVPFTWDMIFTGCCGLVVTTLAHEQFTAVPEPLIQRRGIALYDPRKDTSVGGDGPHRLALPETWEWTDNPVIVIYNILLGIRYAGEWFWGGQGITQAQLPFDVWSVQADKCDEMVETGLWVFEEKRFRCGYEISVDQQPQAVIMELLRACEGRIGCFGGVFKILVGEPGEPVASITDEDIVTSESRTHDPFPGLEETHNGIAATYPEPTEGWGTKESPPLYRSDLEALDDGRRLPVPIAYNAVPYAAQVQRLNRAAVEEMRRFRKMLQTMPPDWWQYEPLDAYEHTSAREGYDHKLFLIAAMDDLPNSNQAIVGQEQDPADYGWSPGYALPVDFAPLRPAGPPALQMYGWSVAPATIKDAAGIDRRPAIEVSFKGDLDDVDAVHVLVREDFGDENIVFDGSLPYGPPDAALKSALLTGTWTLPNTDYEVQGEFVTRSGSRTEKSAWLGVTTPNVLLTSEDINLILDDIAEEVAESVEGMLRFVDPQEVRDLKERLRRASLYSLEQDGSNTIAQQEIRESLTLTAGSITAAYEDLVQLRVTELNGSINAVASRATTLELALTGYTGANAVATAFSGQAVQISDNAGNITVVGNRVDAIDLALTGYSGTNAVANAFSARDVSISAAQTTADGRNRVFRQGTAPTATAIGDLWIHTSENNRLYRASATGSGSWVLSEDQRVPALVDTVAAQGDALDLLDVSVGKFSASGLFRTSVLATMSGAQSTIGISVAASSGAATQTAAMVFNANSSGLSEIGIIANRFFVATNTAGAGKSGVFVIDGGVVYMDNALIRQLDASKINVSSLSSLTANMGTLTAGEILL